MTLFRRLAVGSTAATFLLVTIGGLVRATKSGLGCGTNWPHCPGNLSRAMIIEFSHRGAAGIVVILLGTLAFLGFRHRRSLGRLATLSYVAFGLVLFQAVLGAVVVWLELKAESVVLHLGTAMALLALLVYVSVAATAVGERPGVHTDRSVARLLAVAAGCVLTLMLLGSFVTGTGAGNVFPDWPLMNGKAVPDLGSQDELVHFAHRAFAALTGLIVAAAVLRLVRSREVGSGQRRLGVAIAALFAFEVLVGAANVWTDLNAAWVTIHLAVGASIWGSLVAAAAIASPGVTRPAARESLERRQPVLEAS